MRRPTLTSSGFSQGLLEIGVLSSVENAEDRIARFYQLGKVFGLIPTVVGPGESLSIRRPISNSDSDAD